MNYFKQHKYIFLFGITIVLSIAVIVGIAFNWVQFQNKTSLPNGYLTLTPTLSVTAIPKIELNVGKRIPGTEEEIQIFSSNTVKQDQVELVRLFVENGEVLEVSSNLIALPVCENSKMYMTNKVCVDITKFTPMDVNELIATIKIKWDETLEGKIWKEDGGVYTDEDVLGIETSSDEQAISFIESYENDEGLSEGLQILFLAGVVVATILITVFFKRSQKAQKISKFFNVIVIVNIMVFTIYVGNYINSKYIYPETVSASLQLIEANELVTPVYYLNVWNQFGHASNHCSAAAPLDGMCHTGIDLGQKQIIFSSGVGRVIEAQNGYNSGRGNYVIVQHNTTSGILYTLYYHLETIYVSVNDYVDSTSPLGMMGKSGFMIIIDDNDPTHLHFELRNNLSNAESSIIDPTSLIYRTRSLDPNSPTPPSNPPGNIHPTTNVGNVTCGSHCNLDTDCKKGLNVQSVECDQKYDSNNNKCIILECKPGFELTSNECACKPIVGVTVTDDPTVIDAPSPSITNIPSKSPVPTNTKTPTPTVAQNTPAQYPIGNGTCGSTCNNKNDCIKGANVSTYGCLYNEGVGYCKIISCKAGFTKNGCTCAPNNSSVLSQEDENHIYCGPLDYDNNNRIDAFDLTNFVSKYNKSCTDNTANAEYVSVDINKDGIVNVEDLSLFGEYYRKGTL